MGHQLPPFSIFFSFSQQQLVVWTNKEQPAWSSYIAMRLLFWESDDGQQAATSSNTDADNRRKSPR